MANETALTRTDSANTTALVVITPEELGGLNMPAILDRETAMEIFEANMEGVTMRFDPIKIPGGGGLNFEVASDDDESTSMKKLAGIILDHYPQNAMWIVAYGEGERSDAPPDCSAPDGKFGVVREGVNPVLPDGTTFGGDCRKCPLNQFGSEILKNGQPGKGKRCKNLHRVYFLLNGTMFPYKISLPPTSLGNFSDYMRRLSGKGKPCYAVATEVSLEKAVSVGGINYSKAVFKKIAEFTPQAAMAVKTQIIAKMKESMRKDREQITAEDYGAEATSEAAATSAARMAQRQGGASNAAAGQQGTQQPDGEPF